MKQLELFSGGAEPELPEGEKLSWVVLGRATVVTGAEGTSMQQAALSLAAGQLMGRQVQRADGCLLEGGGGPGGFGALGIGTESQAARKVVCPESYDGTDDNGH